MCLDADQNVWLMLHSGSRRIGKELAEIHISKAKKLAHNKDIPDRDLAVFLAGTPEMQQYRHDLYWAQEYAHLNRQTMLMLLKQAIVEFFPQANFEEAIMCHHNYVAEEFHFGEEVFVTRKGAISADVGQLGIIPGSMGTRCRMSRGKAKRTFSDEDIQAQLEGVECRKDTSIKDELPGAYKDIDQVMANQSDLVEVVAQLKQVLCVKG